ncbi:hypothetical protein Pcinc_001953 [Petrolisthes cinctipes]|uniref:Uncharacterized protein n=1 Tax=Petrolisthes cinctipes TaxID=88211 RepID=A0AAE1GQS8_PETCI|nr:hypothetical protein Pcinc_001953 [Petrolisthes cinctipes]
MSVITQEQDVRLFLARSPSREEVCALSKNDLMMVARELQVEFVVDDLKEVILSRVCNRLFGGEFGEGATGSLFSEGEREAMSAQQMKHQLELAKVQAELQMNLAKEQTEQARISLELRKLENEHVLSEREINKRFDVPSQMREKLRIQGELLLLQMSMCLHTHKSLVKSPESHVMPREQ